MAEVRRLHLKQAKMEEVNRTSADVKKNNNNKMRIIRDCSLFS